MKRTSNILIAILFVFAAAAQAQYVETKLTGYKAGQGTRFIDPNLNGWGMVPYTNNTFCVANAATGVATFYDRSGKPQPLVITIPPAPSQPFGPVGSPSGVAYNNTRDFVISANGRSAPAKLIFDTLDGVICGWNPAVDATHAIIMVDNSNEAPFPASYTALAIGQDSHGRNVLYAADGGYAPDFSNNRFDIFNGQFQMIGSFTDPKVATQFPGNTAFQVENEDGTLYCTFGGFSAPFGGVVDVFDRDGNLLTPNHFAANAGGKGPLVNPWPIAKAPSGFGKFSGAILIGNVEDGKINAFDGAGRFLGTVSDTKGKPIVIPGLWDFTFDFGPNGQAQGKELFFTAGANVVDFAGNGLFGFIKRK